MATSSKKKRVQDEISGENDMESNDNGMDGENNDQEEDMEGQEVQVDFEARNPEDCDFHGIRKLLNQVYLKANVNISEMTDIILGQNYVGSVIKQCPSDSDMEDDDSDDANEVFGIVSVINTTEKKDVECIKQLRTFLLEKCSDKSTRSKLSDIFNSGKPVGLLINERFINIPPQIALPSFNSLWKEIDRAKQKRMPYHFDIFLMISKTYQAPALPGQPKNTKKELLFTNAEEEFFYQEASIQFDYSVASERDTAVSGSWENDDAEMEPLRTVMVIPADHMSSIMNKLGQALAQ